MDQRLLRIFGLTPIQVAIPLSDLFGFGTMNDVQKCLTALRTPTPILYCRNCKGRQRQEYVLAKDAFLCLKCGLINHLELPQQTTSAAESYSTA